MTIAVSMAIVALDDPFRVAVVLVGDDLVPVAAPAYGGTCHRLFSYRPSACNPRDVDDRRPHRHCNSIALFGLQRVGRA